ncbi:MAG: glycosyltransferase family 2 protein [Fidelibacterota bacterium]
MTPPRVSVCILNWNGKELTRDCLESFKTVTYPDLKLLVVDNASTDGSVEFFKRNYPHVEVLALPENRGFAGGNNAGFQRVKGHDSKYVVFLNNDTTVEPHFIEHLIRPLERDSQVGITVPKIYYADDPERIWYAGGKVNLWLGIIAHAGIRELDADVYSTLKVTDYATGCCFCIRSELFATLDGFDESYAMYGEDVDLSLRTRTAGKMIIYVPEAKVWHRVSASIGGAFSKQKLIRKLKAHWRIVRRFASPFQWITIAFFVPILVGISIVRYYRYR